MTLMCFFLFILFYFEDKCEKKTFKLLVLCELPKYILKQNKRDLGTVNRRNTIKIFLNIFCDCFFKKKWDEFSIVTLTCRGQEQNGGCIYDGRRYMKYMSLNSTWQLVWVSVFKKEFDGCHV